MGTSGAPAAFTRPLQAGTGRSWTRPSGLLPAFGSSALLCWGQQQSVQPTAQPDTLMVTSETESGAALTLYPAALRWSAGVSDCKGRMNPNCPALGGAAWGPPSALPAAVGRDPRLPWPSNPGVAEEGEPAVTGTSLRCLPVGLRRAPSSAPQRLPRPWAAGGWGLPWPTWAASNFSLFPPDQMASPYFLSCLLLLPLGTCLPLLDDPAGRHRACLPWGSSPWPRAAPPARQGPGAAAAGHSMCRPEVPVREAGRRQRGGWLPPHRWQEGEWPVGGPGQRAQWLQQEERRLPLPLPLRPAVKGPGHPGKGFSWDPGPTFPPPPKP